jgi:hypothetical protein
MRHIVICGLPHSTIFSTFSHKWRDFHKKKNIGQTNVCFDFLYKFCMNYFSKKMSDILLKMYIVLHAKYPLFLFDFIESLNLLTFFEKTTNVKFHENPSSGSRAVPCRRTGMTKQMVALRNFANAPKKALLQRLRYICRLSVNYNFRSCLYYLWRNSCPLQISKRFGQLMKSSSD